MTNFPKPGDIYTRRLGRDHGGHSPDENLHKRSSQQSTLLQIQKCPLCSTVPEVQRCFLMTRSKLLAIRVGNEQTKQLSLSYVCTYFIISATESISRTYFVTHSFLNTIWFLNSCFSKVPSISTMGRKHPLEQRRTLRRHHDRSPLPPRHHGPWPDWGVQGQEGGGPGDGGGWSHNGARRWGDHQPPQLNSWAWSQCSWTHYRN